MDGQDGQDKTKLRILNLSEKGVWRIVGLIKWKNSFA